VGQKAFRPFGVGEEEELQVPVGVVVEAKLLRIPS
jgi:hypothetical protein